MPKNFKFAVSMLALALAVACGATFAAAQSSTSAGSQAQTPTPGASASSPQSQTSGQSQAGNSGQSQEAVPASQVDETIAWLTQSVNLTPDQQNKLRPILQGEVTQMNAVGADSTLSPTQKQQKMLEIRRAAGPQIQGILTPEQQQKLTQMRQSQQGGGGSPQH
ncbi:MAG TPA: hypothetical protein VKW78_15975 [Terriglobales bacterium]|jgi:hypothetical protein|nr:hypothetical protein [Terriglobales bacterium]